MKRFSLIVLGLILSLNIYSQESDKFKTGVELIEKNIPDEFKDSDSILFIFDVVGCQANFYNDLKKQIKKQFRKSNKKIRFNFNINTNVEKEKIPTVKHSANEFDLTCQINVANFKGWDNDLYKKRKQNYDLVLKIKKNGSDSVNGLAMINVNSYWTIVTQNRNTSRLIFKLFND